ncbi:hypothetical protein BK005_01805 [bacterium CG10_37_50]|nr:MAG: hypothetical protein BK005_01805 [bacterium CG10_37_50]
MSELKNQIKQSCLYPVLLLDDLITERFRRLLLHLLRYIIFILVLIFVVYQVSTYWSPVAGFWLFLIQIKNKILGLLFINLSLFGIVYLLELYFSARYYFELIAQNRYQAIDSYTFSVGRILFQLKDDDLLASFGRAKLGRAILRRLGLSQAVWQTFLATPYTQVLSLPVPKIGPVVKMSDLMEHFLLSSPEFKTWLLASGIKEADFLGAVNWVILQLETRELSRRWWLPENLLRRPGIGQDWVYGETYNLDLWSRDLLKDEIVSSLQSASNSRQKELQQLENILVRSREDNALIIGSAGPDKLDLVYHLARSIYLGKTLGPLRDRRPVLLESAKFISAFKDKNTFEQGILKIFSDAARAGNIILVIDDFPNLLASAKILGSNLALLIDPFLTAPELQVIGLVDLDHFHDQIENQVGLLSRFEKIKIEALSSAELAELLLRQVSQIETDYHLFFTYQAIMEINHSAEYYFPDSISSDKTMDLLLEIAPWAKQNNLTTLGQAEVLSFIQSKTNIPLGVMNSEDKTQLNQLEATLSARVIGQTEAIKSVANAIRRARVGIRNPNRPIGSFLFLGPTGVGKTETAKALAAAFFGQEEEMRRLDMSEFQGADAIARLIGSYTSGQAGLLSSLIREHPYGVVLLDEFEKTSPEILNLFLPVFDEGVFADGSGKKVFAKNTIFIATSNAGSDLIWQLVSAGKTPQATELVEAIVSQGIFKPELLNRFDAVVVYQPLAEAELIQVARLMLKKLATRLEAKGIVLGVTDFLVTAVAQNGANKVFGARPMQRYIQDNIEQSIADLLINDTLSQGMKVYFEADSNSGSGLAPRIEKM